MLLILVSGVGLGVAAERRLNRRQIRLTAAPIKSVWKTLAGSSEFEQLPLLQESFERCQTTLCAESMALSAEDAQVLSEFLSGCGTADVTGEVERCTQYARLFHERSQTAREDAVRCGRLYVTLGICGGSMAALLLGG